MLLPYMLLFLHSTQTSSLTKGRLPASTWDPPTSQWPPTGTCCTWGAATVCTVAGGERLQRAIGRLRQHPLGLHRLHLLLDGDRLHLGGSH